MRHLWPNTWDLFLDFWTKEYGLAKEEDYHFFVLCWIVPKKSNKPLKERLFEGLRHMINTSTFYVELTNWWASCVMLYHHFEQTILKKLDAIKAKYARLIRVKRRETYQEAVHRFFKKTWTQTNGSTWGEKELEIFLVKHLETVEEGLRPIDTQVVLPFGRLDILARNERGRLVVIEVKFETDTDIVWQSFYYRDAVCALYGETPLMYLVVPVMHSYIYRYAKFDKLFIWSGHFTPQIMEYRGEENELFSIMGKRTPD